MFNRFFGFGPKRPFRHSKHRSTPKPRTRLCLEPLEDRAVPSNINWINRGSDGFDSVFGANANLARSVVDAAITSWTNVISDFHQPGGGNTLNVTIVMAPPGPPQSNGTGGSSLVTGTTSPVNGWPTAGAITLLRGDDSRGSGYFLDPTPFEHSEYLAQPDNAYHGFPQTGSPAAGLADLLSTVTHELGHLMGLHPDPRLRIHSFARNTGLADNSDGGGRGHYYAFVGPNFHHLLTSFNSGGPDGRGTDMGRVVHSAAAPDPAFPFAFEGRVYQGATDLMNAFGRGGRYLIPNTMAFVLGDAYNYGIVAPDTLGTFHAVLNQSTGALVVRGRQDATSNDTITLAVSGGDLTVAIDVGNPVPGTAYTGTLRSTFPLDQVRSIQIVTGAGNDTINVEGLPARAAVTIDTDDGNDTINLSPSGRSEVEAPITIGAGNGNDVINIEGLGAGRPATIDGGPGGDRVNLSPTAHNLSAIQSAVTFTGGTGPGLVLDQLFLFDDRANAGDFYTVTNSTVRVANLLTFAANYDAAVEHVELFAANEGNTINVLSTRQGSLVRIHAGTGNDTINVGNAGRLDGQRGSLYILGQGGTNFLNVNDQNLPTGATYTITLSTVGRTSTAALGYSEIERLTVNAGTGNDTINVVSTVSTIRVNAGGGNDTINVGGGNVEATQNTINIDGGDGSDTLNVNDTAWGGGGTWTVTGTRVSVVELPAVEINCSTVENLALSTGAGVDVINVESTAAGSSVTVNAGAGNDTITVGSSVNEWLENQGDLTVNGQGGSNILVVNDPNTSAAGVAYEVTATAVIRPLNGNRPVTYAGIAELRLNAGAGGNNIRVLSTAADTLTLVNAGAGDDTVTLGNAVNRLDDILGPLDIQGATGADTLTLNDTGTTAATRYLLNSFGVRRGDRQLLTYRTFENLTLLGGSGGNTIAVPSMSGVTTLIRAGTGNDTVTVGTSTLDDIHGSLGVIGQGGTDSLILQDEATLAGQTYIVENAIFFRTGMPALSYDSVEQLTLHGGRGGNAVHIQANGPTAVTVHAGAGNDLLQVGTTGDSLGGIQSPVTLNGQGGADTVILNDQGTTTPWTYTVTSSTVARAGIGLITYGTTEELILNGGGGGNTVNVPSTAAGFTTINAGPGNDTINVGNNLNLIVGALVVNGEGGSTDQLQLIDLAASLHTYAITATGFLRTDAPTITGIDYVGVEQFVLTLLGTINVWSTAATTSVTLHLGALTPTVNVGSPAGSLDDIRGPLFIHGGAQSARLNINDQAASGPVDYTIEHPPFTQHNFLRRTGAAPIYFDHQVGLLTVRSSPSPHTFTVQGLHNNGTATIFGSGADRLIGPLGTITWALTGTNAGTVSGTYPYLQAPVSFSGIADLEGGADTDTFRFDAGASLSGSLNGGAGVNTVDYSAYTTDLYVNLRTGTATGVDGSISNIRNVIGGSGNDILVGNGGNRLEGASGRDLLIAGASASTLTGGSDDGILIAGTTAYDSNRTALEAIMAAWARDASYAERVANLTSGIGVPLLNAATITSNGGRNTLTGGAGLDLFFATLAPANRDVLDWDPASEMLIEL